MTINAKPATRRAARLGALIALGALALTGCTTASTAPADRPSAAAPAATAAADSVAVHDAWIKAVDSGMTGAFGQLENTGTADVTVVSVSTEISHMVELHETVENEAGEMTMREVEDGFNIAAGDTLLLEPGANHIMLMGIEQPLVAGDVVSFTVLFSDDSTLTFEAPVKDYSGANENYEGAEHGEHDEHGEMDH